MNKSFTPYKIAVVAVSVSLALSACTKPKQTTAIGAAAGTAIGAGLGAIIGNQTGNAGSGVAIGAVAGAATGALVGNALQAQKEAIASTDEAISRQDQALRAQRSEIEELRRMQSDTSTGQTSTVNAYLVEQKRMELRKRGPAPRGQQSVSRYVPPPLPSKSSEPLARYSGKPSQSVPRVAPAQQPKIENSAPPSSTGGSLKEVDLASAASAQAPAVAPQQDTTAKAALKTSVDSTCEESKQVREAATSATDDSEKLFHLRKALRLCPNSAETHYEMGKTYLNMDRAADANYEFKQALSINPGHKEARQSLEELDQGKSHY